MHLKIIHTEDGSTSLYDEKLKENYHSSFGAINESMHVFIEAGLNHIKGIKTINILEIGLGTGLNALLSCIWCEEKSIAINYFAIEPFPIKTEIVQQMNYGNMLEAKKSNDYYNQIHELPNNHMNAIHSKFNLIKLDEKLELYLPPENFFCLIYFDAFSPDIQSKMWSLLHFKKLFGSLKKNGIFVTYCAKGQVRRDLETAGFVCERIPGPKGKREMLRAIKF